MIYYTIFNTKQGAELISKELYRLSIGGKIEEGWTQFLLSIIEHPEGDQWALEIDTEAKIPMLVNLNPNPSLLINYYKSLGEITEQEEQEFTDKCKHGSVVTLGDIIPEATKTRFKTFEQMQADGWFIDNGEV